MKTKGIRPSVAEFHPRLFPEPIIGPRTAADQLILDWCNQHGLLGLVPVLSNSIRLPATNGPGKDEYARVVNRCHHYREGGSWSSWSVFSNPTATTPEAAEEGARRIADASPKPGVTWFNWLSHMYDEKPLEHIELFFRPIWKDEPLNPPCPNTRQFWESYGEPIQDFTYWCERFALSVGYMSQWGGGRVNSQDALRTVVQSHRLLSGIAQGVGPSFQFNPERNRVDEERVSAGLVASYSLMFLWDREEGRRALRCQNCHAYFVSNESRARYCSPRCRNTAQSRRYRSKKEGIE